MTITRRSLLAGALVGGAAASTGLLSACAKGADTAASSGAASSGATAVTGSAIPSASQLSISAAELTPFAPFAWQEFNGEALFAMGGCTSQVAEPGELFRIFQTINAQTGNPAEPSAAAFDAYCQVFGAFGDQLAALAQSSGTHPVTQRTRLLRASQYATQQLFFILGGSQGSTEEQVFNTVESRWNAAAKLFKPAAEQFQVQSDFGPIPGYFFAPDESKDRKPTVIISSGSDGQNVESMQFGVTAALQRGYNVVLFEGPGQMTPLFVRSVMFTPDWDKVIGPVLEWTKARDDVGKIGLIGVSFAGMLCARAAANLQGLSAVVLEPGGYSYADAWQDQNDVAQVRSTMNLPAAEKQQAQQNLNSGFQQVFPTLSRGTQFNIYKRGSILTQATQSDARANRPLSDYYGLLEAMLAFDYQQDYGRIKIPTMITSNEGDQFFGQQGVQAFDLLTNVPPDQKALVQFTAPQGAQLHDQPNGPTVAQEYIFDWLDPFLSAGQ
ncbi:MAG: hypothetical protein RLZ55_1171 [Actinomycetota bacterium]